MNVLIGALMIFVAGIISPVHAAGIYRWVDANGKVQYSDQPPIANSTQVEKLKAPRASPAPTTGGGVYGVEPKDIAAARDRHAAEDAADPAGAADRRSERLLRRLTINNLLAPPPTVIRILK